MPVTIHFTQISMLALTADKLFTPDGTIERPLVLIDRGKVAEISSFSARALPPGSSLRSFDGAAIVPGYIDLHIHGAAGFDLMSGSTDAFSLIEQMLARHGVTSYLPTTITAPMDRTLTSLELLADLIEQPAEKREGRAQAVGIHIEGPFLSHRRRGVHPPENLLPPRIQTFERFWEASRGNIRMMTIAPELEGAEELIAEAARRGVCVSVGHSDADVEATERGIAHGARHATHTFNAMRPLEHRSPGILGTVLTDKRLSADIIADGVHVDPSIVRMFATLKGPDNTVLITDGLSATGMPDGHYHLGSLDVEVKDGRCIANGVLAGSVLTMDRAVRNLAAFAEWPISKAVATASRNPARVADLKGKGVLAPGSDADIVILNAAGEVLQTFIGGIEA